MSSVGASLVSNLLRITIVAASASLLESVPKSYQEIALSRCASSGIEFLFNELVIRNTSTKVRIHIGMYICYIGRPFCLLAKSFLVTYIFLHFLKVVN